MVRVMISTIAMLTMVGANIELTMVPSINVAVDNISDSEIW